VLLAAFSVSVVLLTAVVFSVVVEADVEATEV
jgi:hypothetical protein